MGTSKSYITPTKKEWSDAKRSVSSMLNNMNLDTKNNVISKYAKAMKRDYIENEIKSTSAIRKIINLSKSISVNGVYRTLEILDRLDLIDKNPEEVLTILLNEYCNNGNKIEEKIELDAISIALETLGIKSIDELNNISLEDFLKEIIINYVNESFKFRFEEKIGLKKSPEEKQIIMNGLAKLMRNEIIENIQLSDINNVDFSNLSGDEYVNNKIRDAYNYLELLYLED